jgi:hypothetical protein
MNSPCAGTGHVSGLATPARGLHEPDTSGDSGCRGQSRTAPEARQEGSPARQRWEGSINHAERRRRGTRMSREAVEWCRPSGARRRFCRLPRAYALGYLLNAPYGAGLCGHRDMNPPGLPSRSGSLWPDSLSFLPHDFAARRSLRSRRANRTNTPARENRACRGPRSSRALLRVFVSDVKRNKARA